MWFFTQMSITSRASCKRHAAALLGIEPVHRKAAEVALGVADVGDGKLQITRPAMVEHLAEAALSGLGLGPGHRAREVNAGSRRVADGAAERFKMAVLMLVKSRILPGKPAAGQIFLGWDMERRWLTFPINDCRLAL